LDRRTGNRAICANQKLDYHPAASALKSTIDAAGRGPVATVSVATKPTTADDIAEYYFANYYDQVSS
jgi:hypothetical protein